MGGGMTWLGSDVTLKDSAQLDAFSRLRVSQSSPLFDSQQEYGLCTRRCWDGVVFDGATNLYTITSPSSNGSISDASGNAIGPVSTNTRMCPITVSSTNGHYSILQSRVYHRYIPGKSQIILMTGIFAAGASATMKLTRRTSTSGSVVDNDVDQSAWSIDKFDGAGPSGITLDFTKTQILVIDAQGVGRVRVGFNVGGVLYYAHEFLSANVLAVPYTQHFNLPVRFEGRTAAGATSFRVGYFDSANGIFLSSSRVTPGGTCHFICCSVQSEGGAESRGFPRTVGNTSARSCNTSGVPIISLRPATTYNSRTNRVHIEEILSTIDIVSGKAFWTIYAGGSVTGGSWVAVPSDSAAEYNITATSIANGVAIAGGVVSGGAGANSESESRFVDIRNPLVISLIDSLTATQVPVTLFIQATTGTVDAIGVFNWNEQVI